MRTPERHRNDKPALRIEQARREIKNAVRTGHRGAQRKAKTALNEYRKDLEYEE
jgi:hypothetical protein